MASFSHTITSNHYWNGNTNHKYHTNNSPTSRGKYLWMILTSPLTAYLLWYLVTNITILSSMKMFLCPSFVVLLWRILNISSTLTGCPATIYINIINFS
ncbi:hypothetical protein K469DRAFT_765594, partial [Zopfia rhizophila CBS 207.26]